MMHNIAILIIVSLTTMLVRALPFMIFGRGQKTPAYILYLGDVLPPAIMMMLVVYCLKDVNVLQLNAVLPSAIAVALTVLLQWYKHNTLLSIIAGTVTYMLLIQLVFI